MQMSPERITISDLNQFPEFVAFRTSRNSSADAAPSVVLPSKSRRRRRRHQFMDGITARINAGLHPTSGAGSRLAGQPLGWALRLSIDQACFRSVSLTLPAVPQGPQVGLQYRNVRAAVLIPRARPDVWVELSAVDHPAWSSPEAEGQQHQIKGDDDRLSVGSVLVTGPFQMPPHGLRQVWWTEVTSIVQGWMITTETYAGFFEHTETLILEDHPEGTYARIEGVLRRTTTPEGADNAQQIMTRMAEEHLRRAADWTPGVEPRPVIIRPPGF